MGTFDKNHPCIFGTTNKCSFWHVPPKYNPEINFSNYKLTFCIIRDPLERFISESNFKKVPDINKFAIENLKMSEECEPITNNLFDCHLIHQVDFLNDIYGNKVTDILRFENFNEEIKNLITKYNLNINFSGEKNNQSIKLHNISSLTEENIKLIKLFYQKDYDFLYELDHIENFIN